MGRLVAKIVFENGVSFSISESNLPLQIGRGANCGIRVPLGHVSRLHCELYLENEVLHLRDTSANGTRVGHAHLKGNSMALSEPTAVQIARGVKLTIVPCEITEFSELIDEDGDAKGRRLSDRRQLDRRTLARVVSIERREQDNRRCSKRRHEQRRRA